MFCGCNRFRCDPKLFILVITIKLLRRMENKICGSILILLKIMVIFPVTWEGSEISAFRFFFFAITRSMHCWWDVSFCHLLEIRLLTVQISERHMQLLFWFLFFICYYFQCFIVNEASVVILKHKSIILSRWYTLVFHVHLWKSLFHLCTVLDYVD